MDLDYLFLLGGHIALPAIHTFTTGKQFSVFLSGSMTGNDADIMKKSDNS